MGQEMMMLMEQQGSFSGWSPGIAQCTLTAHPSRLNANKLKFAHESENKFANLVNSNKAHQAKRKELWMKGGVYCFHSSFPAISRVV